MKNSFFRHITFKYLLLLLLSIKVGEFVYDSFSTTVNIENAIVEADNDIDVEEDSKQQDDKKTEFDENNKINQAQVFFFVHNENITLKTHHSLSKSYRDLHLDFTTPPPEFV